MVRSRWPRARTDNLVFVVNCNLQRLDGPCAATAAFVQVLEAAFRGAGWKVIKLSGATLG